MRIVVLGASGFLGSAIVGRLSTRHVALRAVARRATATPARPTAEIEVRRADLTVPGDLAGVVADADAIVHLPLYDSGASWRVEEGDEAGLRVNVGIAENLVGLLREAGREVPPVLLFAGSTSQVGLPRTGRIDGGEVDAPVTEYDRQKLAAERAFMTATAEGVVRAVSLRLPTLFGHSPMSANTDRGVVVTMIRRALAGEPLTVWGDGSVTRDLLHVGDAAEAFVAALDHAHALAGRHWLVGSGRSIGLTDLFTEIAAAVAAHTGRPPVPVVSVAPAGRATEADFHCFDIDPSAFRRLTGWRPRAGLGEALRRTVAALAEPAFTHSTT
ncbi:NAD-dependent epimerase/dehydratase family protein [Streptosporangium sp. DT93]|uniref:NAD-dependent epimerase/dehydratase family protein n=1 Tax=Streptosporangium sp. DT93 TaxID=3393428 RepID=UPI003CE8142B